MIIPQQGRYIGFDNGGATVNCSTSAELMDDLERRSDVPDAGRDDQFGRLRERLEEMAARKFFSFLDDRRPATIDLTTKDMG